MVSGKYSALTGAITREMSIANTSANLANVSTVGYKKNSISFEAILNGEQQTKVTKGVNYNRIGVNFTDFSQGPLKNTDNPFDMAIKGDGFFKIRTAEGDLLTRKGNFVVGDDGRLLTDSGKPVLSAGNSELFIPTDSTSSIVVDKNGILSTINKNGESSEIGQLAIVDVADRSVLLRKGDTSYALPKGAVETPAKNFSVIQGSVEVSNVNMTEEMTKMIRDNRLFQTYHNVFENYSKLSDKIAELGTL